AARGRLVPLPPGGTDAGSSAPDALGIHGRLRAVRARGVPSHGPLAAIRWGADAAACLQRPRHRPAGPLGLPARAPHPAAHSAAPARLDSGGRSALHRVARLRPWRLAEYMAAAARPRLARGSASW